MTQTPKPLTAEYEAEPYTPLKGARRWLVGALGLGTAVGVMWLMTRPVKPVPAHLVPAPRPQLAPEPPRCRAGQTQDCVGGQAAVFAVPPEPAAKVR